MRSLIFKNHCMCDLDCFFCAIKRWHGEEATKPKVLHGRWPLKAMKGLLISLAGCRENNLYQPVGMADFIFYSIQCVEYDKRPVFWGSAPKWGTYNQIQETRKWLGPPGSPGI